jgi:copper(I)-binding protein
MSSSIRTAVLAACASAVLILGRGHALIPALLALAASLAPPAWAQDYKAGSLEVSGPWTRATAPTARAGGGYLTITNRGTAPDRLIAARSSVSDKVEIHEMKMEGSVMRMRALEKGLEIPPGATVTLAPGGFHIMFMELRSPLAKGAKVPATLVFEKAGAVDVEFLVQDIGAVQPSHSRH